VRGETKVEKDSEGENSVSGSRRSPLRRGAAAVVLAKGKSQGHDPQEE